MQEDLLKSECRPKALKVTHAIIKVFVVVNIDAKYINLQIKNIKTSFSLL